MNKSKYKKIKNCKNCGKTMYFKKFMKSLKKPQCGIGSWVNKKFCSKECRVKYYNEKKSYKLKKSFHNKIVKKINKKINGNIIKYQGHQKGFENCDIKNKNVNYEIEVLSKYHKFKKKYKRHVDDGKKHIMYIVPDIRLFEFFDEIKFINPKTFSNKLQ